MLRLWFTRSTPHAFSCSACSGVSRPRQAQIFRLYCCLISGTIVVTACISRSFGPRAEMTMQ